MHKGGKKHLNADEKFLDGCSKILGLIGGPAVVRLDQIKAYQKRNEHRLPESEENDHFDTNELWDGPHRMQVLFGCIVEHDQTIQCPHLRQTVDDDHIRIHIVEGELSFHEDAKRFRDDGDEGHAWSPDDILDDPSSACVQEVSVLHAPGLHEISSRKEVLDRFFEFKAALQIFSQHLRLFEVGQKVVVEAVDDDGFVAFSPRREIDPCVAESQCKPGVPGVDGHHQQDSDDVLLQVRFGVVFEVHGHFPEGDRRGQHYEDTCHEPSH